MLYWYSDFPSEPTKISCTQEQIKRTWQGLTDLINEISAKQSFPLTDDERICSFCRYRSYCERGTNAGTGEDEYLENSSESRWQVNMEQIQEIEF
jgi:hypothetical protein